MSDSIEIVATTIHEPAWLPGYLENLRRYGHDRNTRISIIADRKTPASVYAAAEAARRQGFDVWCPSLDEQVQYLTRLGAPADFIPWNSDNRRNIGFLAALERGASVLISIDDDNYCRDEEDLVGAHLVVGGPPPPEDKLVEGAPWFNVCTRLEYTPAVPIFPRGFPYAARKEAGAARLGAPEAIAGGRIAVNAGLWLDDPDVDASTRLAVSPHVHAAKPGSVILSSPTWSPINSQNTAIIADAVPAYYYVRMGHLLAGARLDRFGDIFSGYFLQKCAKHLGDLVRFGSPVCVHRRSPHDLLQDLYHELPGIRLLEEFVPWLQEVRLSGNTYGETYAELASVLEAAAMRFRGTLWNEGGRDFLLETCRYMRVWLELVVRVSAGDVSAGTGRTPASLSAR